MDHVNDVPDSTKIVCMKHRQYRIDGRPASAVTLQKSNATHKDTRTHAKDEPATDLVSASPQAPCIEFLQLCINTLETPLQDYEGDFQTEDLDLIPRFEDWELVYNYFTRSGTGYPQANSFDAEVMLYSYFQKPASMRLVLCAWTFLKYKDYQLEAANFYFKRARKSLNRMDLTPSFDLLLTYNLICSLATELENHAVQESFAQSSMNLAIELQMHIDPDDSPWLSHLTARQKEERRRVFWASYRSYAIVRAFLPYQAFGQSPPANVKYSRQIHDPHPIYMTEEHPLRSQLWNFIGNIKQLWNTPPTDLNHLFSIVINSDSLKELATLQESAPVTHLFLFANPELITAAEMHRFISQTVSTKSELIALNLTYQATICVYFRPMMFATALPSCRPDSIGLINKTLMIDVINKVVDAAWRIFAMFQFSHYVIVQSGESLVDGENRPLFDLFGFSSLDAFEAFICVWFMSCRMDPAWYPYLRSGNCNSAELRAKLGYLISFYTTESRKYGTETDAQKAMIGMLEEMEEVAKMDESGGIRDIPEIGDLFDGLLSVKSTADASKRRCYLGLLGMDYRNRISWTGNTDPAWKLFWKLNS
ncbi:hypothetical protein HDU79_004884 [Rhizoclosmatium sp. JEL0117]|nr:hypothetical protein HDU79_004884 [Rhizoclosmatium sp. JEL0117]